MGGCDAQQGEQALEESPSSSKPVANLPVVVERITVESSLPAKPDGTSATTPTLSPSSLPPSSPLSTPHLFDASSPPTNSDSSVPSANISQPAFPDISPTCATPVSSPTVESLKGSSLPDELDNSATSLHTKVQSLSVNSDNLAPPDHKTVTLPPISAATAPEDKVQSSSDTFEHPLAPQPGVEKSLPAVSPSARSVTFEALSGTPQPPRSFLERGLASKASASASVVPQTVEKVHLRHIDSMPNLVVYFDLETNGFDSDCDIVQLSAVVGQQSFNEYILPSKEISWQAARVTGITYKSGSLYVSGKRVEALEPKEALAKWLVWIKPIAPVVLVAHNCYLFDSRRLVNYFKKHSLDRELKQLVKGFIDTLPMFKEVYPGMASYKQEELVLKILKEPYRAHDGLADVQSLQKLVVTVGLKDKQLLNYSFTLESLLDYMEYAKKGKENTESLKPLVNSRHLSSGMAETIGKSGLNFDHLRQAFVTGGKEFMDKVLSEPNTDGQPRVTRSKTVLNKLHDFFSSESHGQ